MHKSRLGCLVIDCQSGDLDVAGQFWGEALGYQVTGGSEPEDQDYLALDGSPGDPRVLLQRVDHQSRIHLDIETDDVEAEVQRLERLGARRVAQVRTWWVMEAPTGHRFCVVNPERPDFESAANEWVRE